MKLLKKIIKYILLTMLILLTILIINYIRININYYINKNKYEESFLIQGNKNKYTPQGLAYSKKYNIILQTSYNKNHHVSMLYITNYKTGKLKKELKLKEINNSYNTNHVGGITTDEEKVWISNDYEINEYNLNEIINTKKNYIKSTNNKIIPNRGDFCLYNNNILWIGDFYLKPFYNVPNNNPLLIGYNIKDNLDYNNPDYIISLPKMVQGMAITNDNKFIFTTSFTYLINSNLLIYDNVLKEKNSYYRINNKQVPYYKFSNKNLINKIKVPPMAEGIFYKDNYLYILFENSSDTYQYAYPKLYSILKLKINKLEK